MYNDRNQVMGIIVLDKCLSTAHDHLHSFQTPHYRETDQRADDVSNLQTHHRQHFRVPLFKFPLQEVAKIRTHGQEFSYRHLFLLTAAIDVGESGKLHGRGSGWYEHLLYG